jgi:hypothetical protein
VEAVAELRRAVDVSRYGESDTVVAEMAEEWLLPRLDRQSECLPGEGRESGLTPSAENPVV